MKWQVGELDQRSKDCLSKIEDHQSTIVSLKSQVSDLVDQVRRMRVQGGGSAGGGESYQDVRRVEWTIPNIPDKMTKHAKGESIWSTEFGIMGINGIQLEFFPNGRESTTIPGFCSLFLWCPSGTKIKYQLSVGNHLRAPDEDIYDGRMGHGHSNFCMLNAEILDDKSVTVAVDVLDVQRTHPASDSSNGTLKIRTGYAGWLVKKETELRVNLPVERVEWKLINIQKKMEALPRGSSIYSNLFTAAGIREILLEFYPNGSQNTTKDGFCAFYLRCPEGTSVIVTLFVGSFKKGPIQASFDGSAGKGLPDFCDIHNEIRADDTITVGLQIQNHKRAEEENKTILQMES